MDLSRTSQPRLPLRHRSDPWLDDFLDYATKLSRGRALGVVAAVIALAGLADALSGPDAWFGPVYLLIICFSTWTLGWRAGVATGFVCAALGNAVNGLNIYPAGAAAFAWNLLMRILAVATIVILIGSARRSYDREWLRARTDALTGALNKEGFFERLARVGRKDRWALLGYIDLDGLKQINDENGHAAGDDILRAFTNGVRDSIRPADVLARIGGDEFLVYQPAGTREEAFDLARRLHRWSNALRSNHGQLIRCSIGALVIDPHSRAVTEADIARADLLMYDAKKKGAGLSISTRGMRPPTIAPFAPTGQLPCQPDALQQRVVSGR